MNTEIIGLTPSIAYAERLAAEAGLHGPDGNERYLARLAAARVTGAGLTTGHDMQAAFAAAAAAAARHAAELGQQTSVQEAYNAAPDAGDKDFQTGDTGTGTGRPVTAEHGKDAPMTEDESADALYDRALGFIDATTRSQPKQAPPGQDLQCRPAEGHEDDEQPWRSLPVRRADVCEHVDTVCQECLESWSWSHDPRVAEVPVSVDLDAHRAAAAEFYAFEGDPERQLPPYWVAGHGRTVTSQVQGQPVSTTLLADDDRASAEFAGECCDTTPTGPGAPRAGDRIEMGGDHRVAGIVTVSSSSPAAHGHTVIGVDEDGNPFSAQLSDWNYQIVSRPTGATR